MQLGQIGFRSRVTKVGRKRLRMPVIRPPVTDTTGAAKMVQLAEQQAKQLTLTLQRLAGLL